MWRVYVAGIWLVESEYQGNSKEGVATQRQSLAVEEKQFETLAVVLTKNYWLRIPWQRLSTALAQGTWGEKSEEVVSKRSWGLLILTIRLGHFPSSCSCKTNTEAPGIADHRRVAFVTKWALWFGFVVGKEEGETPWCQEIWHFYGQKRTQALERRFTNSMSLGYINLGKWFMLPALYLIHIKVHSFGTLNMWIITAAISI